MYTILQFLTFFKWFQKYYAVENIFVTNGPALCVVERKLLDRFPPVSLQTYQLD